MKIVVAGGGAAGFFAAIACAEQSRGTEVILLEKSTELLAKVTISGGGRCNVTHACYEPAELARRYPRGGRELVGPFHRWQARDTVDWFENRGVKLKTEDDGRIFPVTDKSTTITTCLIQQAEKAGVKILSHKGLAAVEKGAAFRIKLTTGEALDCDRLLVATGGNQNSNGFDISASLGHAIEPLVPSLFTFHVDDPRVRGLQGLSVPDAEVSVPTLKLSQRGPVLITHWGLSGPAILKLSAWGARLLHDVDYDVELRVNWRPDASLEKLSALKDEHARKTISLWSPFREIPHRLWGSLAKRAGIGEDVTWAAVSKKSLQALAAELTSGLYHVTGKSLFKDEFVTCGGVRLREIDFKTMESKLCKGLYFAGEILDIDGVTGGFNFQSAWTTGWIAGTSMGEEG